MQSNKHFLNMVKTTEWVRTLILATGESHHTFDEVGSALLPMPPPPEPSEPPMSAPEPLRKYDLKQSQQQQQQQKDRETR